MSGLLLLLISLLAPATAPAEHVNHTVLKKLNWQFAFPTDSLGSMSILEAGKIAKTLTVHHLEVVVGQPLSAEDPTLLNAQLDDAKVADFVKQLKAIGLDVVSLRVDAAPTDAELPGLFRVASALGAKVVVVPTIRGDLRGLATAAKVKVAVSSSEGNFTPLSNPVGQSILATDLFGSVNHATEARMVANKQADIGLSEALLRAGFKGVVTVAPAHNTQADTIEAMDAFAESLNHLPTTQP